jgi:hypothetical protein
MIEPTRCAALMKNTRGFSVDAADALARFIQAAHQLPPVAAAALAREITLQAYLWSRLPELYLDGLPTSGVPALFKGARGKELVDGLAAFVAKYGGQRLYIPQAVTTSHDFYQVAGAAASAHIVALWGGKPVVVPMIDAMLRPLRDKSLIEDYRGGASLNDIADRYGLAYPIVCAMTRGVRAERKPKRNQ